MFVSCKVKATWACNLGCLNHVAITFLNYICRNRFFNSLLSFVFPMSVLFQNRLKLNFLRFITLEAFWVATVFSSNAVNILSNAKRLRVFSSSVHFCWEVRSLHTYLCYVMESEMSLYTLRTELERFNSLLEANTPLWSDNLCWSVIKNYRFSFITQSTKM